MVTLRPYQQGSREIGWQGDRMEMDWRLASEGDSVMEQEMVELH